jgi:hypothetical protein
MKENIGKLYTFAELVNATVLIPGLVLVHGDTS